jgi:RNase P/RNase MRP subunit p29
VRSFLTSSTHLIGASVEILGSSDNSLLNREGVVVFESKNTISVEIAATKRKIVVPKRNLVLRVEGLDSSFILKGEEILGVVQERIKV